MTHRIFLSWFCVLAMGVIGCAPAARTFVTASGDRLVEGKRSVRFVSFNIPNLHYVEDNHAFEERLPFRLPTAFEIRDALTAIDQMGGEVVRIYTLSVRKADDPPDMPRHVVAPGEFNEAAFRVLDQVVAIAEELDIRLIVPFVDNWWWWGGINEYAAFRGKEKGAFWTDREIIADFKETIRYLLTRTNTVTGIMYRDDPTILAWETGNELESPYPWVTEIAAFIKEIDPNHLVIDGYHSTVLRQEAIDDPKIDLLTTHHYTPADQMVRDITENLNRVRGKKPYFVGEFGFIPTDGIERVLDTVIEGNAMGALLWSLRFRNRDGGFYRHYENDDYRSYHWPGFPSGDQWDETEVLALVRDKAAGIRGVQLSRLPVPEPPQLLPVSHPAEISWRGSVGALSYVVERAPAATGPWKILATGVSDAAIAYRPLFGDTTMAPGENTFYRVRAQNKSGASEPSNVVGPVTLTTDRLVDELVTFDRTHELDGSPELVSDRLQLFRYDISRVSGTESDAIIYKVPGWIRDVRVYAHLPENRAGLTMEVSVDGDRYVRPIYSARDYSGGTLPYHPVLLATNGVAGNTSYVRLNWTGEAQVGRVEIDYLRR